jgi:hypothetical protein
MIKKIFFGFFVFVFIFQVSLVSAQFNWQSSASDLTNFLVQTKSYTCVINESLNRAYWFDSGTGVVYDILTNKGCNATALGVNVTGGTSICCPEGYYCNSSSGSFGGECILREIPPVEICIEDSDCDGVTLSDRRVCGGNATCVCTSSSCVATVVYGGCGDIGDAATCNGVSYTTFENYFYQYYSDSLTPAQRNSLNIQSKDNLNQFCKSDRYFVYNLSGTCSLVGSDGCGCKWNGTFCNTYINSSTCPDPTTTVGPEPPPIVYSCSIVTSTEDKCRTNEKYIIKAVASVYQGNNLVGKDKLPWCNSYTYEVPCVRKTNLNFFGIAGFILSAMAIGLVYLFFERKKRES